MRGTKLKTFKARFHKSGNSFVCTIPKYFIKAGVLDPTEEYEITIKEVENHAAKSAV